MPNKARMILRVSFQNNCLEDVAILNVGKTAENNLHARSTFTLGERELVFLVVSHSSSEHFSPVKMHLPQLSPRQAESILSLSTLPSRDSTIRMETALTQKCCLHSTRPMHRACWFDVLDSS